MSSITQLRRIETGRGALRRQDGTASSLVGRMVFVALIVGVPAAGITAQETGVFYPNIPGELLLENDYVVVQRYIIEPGKWEGIHSHPGNQIAVRIKGGLWGGRRGGREVSRMTEPTKDGSVGWMDAIDISEQHESGNVGDTPIDLVWVTLKACEPLSNHTVGLFYPNIPVETLLENDRVVVQKFVAEPGEWEGVHSHAGNQVYVHIKGGTWAGRLGGREVYRQTEPSKDGSAGWLDAIDLSEGHNSGNVGDTTAELVYVTIKPCRPLATP